MGSDARMKPVLSFVGKQKMLVVNKTNALAIAAQYGNDTTAWVGRDIILKPVMVSFQGKQVLAVRVDTFTAPPPGGGASHGRAADAAGVTAAAGSAAGRRHPLLDRRGS